MSSRTVARRHRVRLRFSHNHHDDDSFSAKVTGKLQDERFTSSNFPNTTTNMHKHGAAAHTNWSFFCNRGKQFLRGHWVPE